MSDYSELTAWSNAVDAMNHQVAEAMDEWDSGIPDQVMYSAYHMDDNRIPVDNTSDVAVEGYVVFKQPYDAFWGDGKSYQSAPIHNPRWIDVACLANEMIATTGDHHHLFLEGVNVVEVKDGHKVVEFAMGS